MPRLGNARLRSVRGIGRVIVSGEGERATGRAHTPIDLNVGALERDRATRSGGERYTRRDIEIAVPVVDCQVSEAIGIDQTGGKIDLGMARARKRIGYLRSAGGLKNNVGRFG